MMQDFVTFNSSQIKQQPDLIGCSVDLTGKPSLLPVLENVNKWNLSSLKLSYMKQNKIIKLIKHINFPNLRKLAVAKNLIQSVEDLNRMELPSLQELYLNYNLIRRVSSLRKGNWKLANLSIHGNFVVDCETTSTSQLESLNIEYTSRDEGQIFDLRWVLKLDSTKMKKINFKSKGRIQQGSIHQCIKNKWKQIQINPIDT